MNRILLFFALSISCILARAQSGWTEGYLVNRSGDTARGFLESDKSKKIVTEIRFRETASAREQKFTPAEISLFQYQDGNQYRAITFENPSGDSAYTETVFAKYLVSGLASLYSFYREDRIFFVVFDGPTAYLLYDNEVSGSGALQEEGNFFPQLTQFSSKCAAEDLRPDNVNYSENDFTAFFLKLNACLYPQVQSYSLYHKTEEKLRILLSGGGMKTATKSNYTGEVLFEFNYPKVNRNICFVTGLVYNYLSERKMHKISRTVNYEYTTNDVVVGLPLAFRYNILRGKIQPYITAGVGAFYITHTDPDIYSDDLFIHKAIDIKCFAGAGIEAYLMPFLLIRAAWRAGVYNQLPTIGFALRF